ncbi:hypothetical protein ABEV74_22565, partial [Paenibacillus cisolokensis]|uniref:hypothetical protein n=1 Tax=Paenibacillus cisolokensis TaxID=1658519 RepID=UPI003D275CCD
RNLGLFSDADLIASCTQMNPYVQLRFTSAPREKADLMRSAFLVEAGGVAPLSEDHATRLLASAAAVSMSP